MPKFFNLEKIILPVALCGAALFSEGAGATTVSVTKSVSALSGPWSYVVGGLNTSFQYGMGDQRGPTIFSATDGLHFSEGDTLTIAYVSGLTSAFGGTPTTDATGYTNTLINNGTGSTHRVMPSYYFNSTDYPAYLNELVGVFANASGTIVGTPFNIGAGQSLVIPMGATQFQLGVNDDRYVDNTGSLLVNVTTATAVPEPSTLALLSIGALFLRRRVRRG